VLRDIIADAGEVGAQTWPLCLQPKDDLRLRGRIRWETSTSGDALHGEGFKKARIDINDLIGLRWPKGHPHFVWGVPW
jgi:hypothetical protein